MLAKAVEDAVEGPDATAKKNNDHWRVVDIVVAAVVSATHDEEFTEGSLQSGLTIVLRGIAIAPPGIILLGRWPPCAWWDC